MRILVVNDDGWDAPGLAALARLAADFGAVVSVAPLEKRSGCGHQLTFDRPLEFRSCGTGSWNVDGMPADCVRLAVSRLGSFDWVLSGINDGANLGVDSWLSGTVAAAREAMILGIPAMAVSQYRGETQSVFSWEQSADLARPVVEQLLARPPGPGRMWNVNLPDPAEVAAGKVPVVECDADVSPLPMDYQHDGERSCYAGRYRQRERRAGTDVDVCFSGRIAVTRM